MEMVEVTPDNILEEGLFCIKNSKEEGFQLKHQWFLNRFNEGLKLKILKDDSRKLGYIEYMPGELAWRPVDASDHMFIQCLYIYAKKDRQKGLGRFMIQDCVRAASDNKMKGVCTMTSGSAWLHNRQLFEKLDFKMVDKRGRFELMQLPLAGERKIKLLNWETKLQNYSGWHLLYSNQCPWHVKSVNVIKNICNEVAVDINIKVLESSEDIKNGPSGFGVFALIRNGRLLADHYISETRFRNILKKELNEPN